MAGPNAKKRSHQEFSVKNRLKAQRPLKKKKQKAYHSDSDEDEDDNANFKPVNLLDSDNDDIGNNVADDGGSSSDSNSDSDPGADSDGEASGRQKLKPKKQKPAAKAQPKTKSAKKLEKEAELKEAELKEAELKEAEMSSGDDDDDDAAEDDNDEFDISAGDDSDGDEAGTKKVKSKRNDPSAFSNSLHKILSTKLATTRRADPLLSRSADAHKAAQAITDEQLESKAKRKLRQERLAALEKGRVKDVLVAPTNEQGQIEASTGQILEKEKQLRKVAQRGVIKLFNAVRAAQIKSADAEKQTRRDGFVGVKNREEKVTEMSRKGFLDLIANSGGGLKKGQIEEA